MNDQQSDDDLGRALSDWVSSTHSFTADEVRATAATLAPSRSRVPIGFAGAVAVFVIFLAALGWAASRNGSSDVDAPASIPPGATPTSAVAQLLPTESGCSVASTVRGVNEDVEPAFSNIVALGLVAPEDVVAVNETMPGLDVPGIAIAVEPNQALPASTESAIEAAAGQTPVIVVERCLSTSEVDGIANQLRSAGSGISLTEATGGFSVSVDTLSGRVVLIGSSEISAALLAESQVDPAVIELVESEVVM